MEDKIWWIATTVINKSSQWFWQGRWGHAKISKGGDCWEQNVLTVSELDCLITREEVHWLWTIPEDTIKPRRKISPLSLSLNQHPCPQCLSWIIPGEDNETIPGMKACTLLSTSHQRPRRMGRLSCLKKMKADDIYMKCVIPDCILDLGNSCPGRMWAI